MNNQKVQKVQTHEPNINPKGIRSLDSIRKFPTILFRSVRQDRSN
jgi:hypothetical protein